MSFIQNIEFPTGRIGELDALLGKLQAVPTPLGATVTGPPPFALS